MSQAERYEEALRSLSEWLLPKNGRRPLFILTCGRRKSPATTTAREMYVSPRFVTCRTFLESTNQNYLIASAKHGLLEPQDIITPYDLNLFATSEEYIRDWSLKLVSNVKSNTANRVVVLGNGDYTTYIADVLAMAGISVSTPQVGLNAIYQRSLLVRASRLHKRYDDASRIYRSILEMIGDGRAFRLSDIAEIALPTRGVYIFLDEKESSVFGGPRIVRIGTHAVSEGSKATLRSRLRNHFGLRSGGGNHRGSVFRLHVGRAMIDSGMVPEPYEFWGSGQNASKGVLAKEERLERRVSYYLGQLMVIILPIDDAASKRSLRAVIETNLIALFSEGGIPLDPGSSDWLGRHSPNPEISSSGLWNIRDVGRRYDESKLQIILDQLAWELT